MQKRKFEDLISYFNRKVSDMSIDQKYKMELLGMISAIGFAHEKELGTNLAEVGTDCISRQAAIDALENDKAALDKIIKGMSAYDVRLDAYVSQRNQVDYDIYAIKQLPPAEPKRGKWNRLDMDTFNCNQCGTTFVLNQGSEKMHFCPNCGVDMRGEQDDKCRQV